MPFNRRTTWEDLPPIIFIAILGGLLVIFLFSGRDLNWSIILILLLFLAVIIFFTWVRTYKEKKLAATWTELALVTGLAFGTKGKSLLGYNIHPRVDGVYRQRKLSITKEVIYVGDYEGGSSIQYTVITLPVTNWGDYAFSLHRRGPLKKLFTHSPGLTGDKQMDYKIDISGSPPTFIKAAARRLLIDKGLLLYRPAGTMMLTTSPLSWAVWTPPAITLKGSELVCRQHGVIANIHTQITYINMLCDIADLVERTQSSRIIQVG
jgi:hypothetical protein